ncbi:MAG: hypothetical protein FWG32_02240 [Oscillospiraceae bacterium]|nr:hypothetical protein [Oscillospiraceae bacterium]
MAERPETKNRASLSEEELFAVITAAIGAYEARGTRRPGRAIGTRATAAAYGGGEPHPLIRNMCEPYEIISDIPAANPMVRNCG